MFCAEASCEIRSVIEADEECLVEICSINDDDLGTVSPHFGQCLKVSVAIEQCEKREERRRQRNPSFTLTRTSTAR